MVVPRFRAWHKEMCSVGNIKFDDEGNVVSVLVKNKFNIFEVLPVGDVVLMQSTGFTDEFDKEIFEGDVILWTYWDEFEDEGEAKVIFDKGMFKLLDIRTEKEVWDNLFDCIGNCNVYLQGNIYENPELLEDK